MNLKKITVLYAILIMAALLAGCARDLLLPSEDALAHQNRGISHWAESNLDEAIAEFSLAIQLDPSMAEAYYNRALAYLWKIEEDKFIGDINQAIRLNPNFTEAYFIRGAAYAILWPEHGYTIADWETEFELNPNHASAGHFRELPGIVY